MNPTVCETDRWVHALYCCHLDMAKASLLYCLAAFCHSPSRQRALWKHPSFRAEEPINCKQKKQPPFCIDWLPSGKEIPTGKVSMKGLVAFGFCTFDWVVSGLVSYKSEVVSWYPNPVSAIPKVVAASSKVIIQRGKVVISHPVSKKFFIFCIL